MAMATLEAMATPPECLVSLRAFAALAIMRDKIALAEAHEAIRQKKIPMEVIPFIADKLYRGRTPEFNGIPVILSEFFNRGIGNTRFLVSIYAIRYGLVDVLRWSYPAGTMRLRRLLSDAVRYGRLECLRYLNGSTDGKVYTGLTKIAAEYRGDIDCLRFLHEEGYPWDADTVPEAAARGNLKCLRFALDKGAPRSRHATRLAAKYGYLRCLCLAHKRNCPVDTETMEATIPEGHFACFRYLHLQGVPWDEEITRLCSKYGRLEMLKYAHENGCLVGRAALRYAIQNRRLECVAFCLNVGLTDGLGE